MARRDRTDHGGRRGQRAARRSRPAFLGSDGIEDEDMGDDELGIASMKKRTRKQYDERRDLDDLDGIEDASRLLLFSCHDINSYPSFVQEIPLEQLSDIKAKSIVEWIAHDRVRRSIVRHFRHFLMSYVDEHGASVYGQRILKLGESRFSSTQTINF